MTRRQEPVKTDFMNFCFRVGRAVLEEIICCAVARNLLVLSSTIKFLWVNKRSLSAVISLVCPG